MGSALSPMSVSVYLDTVAPPVRKVNVVVFTFKSITTQRMLSATPMAVHSDSMKVCSFYCHFYRTLEFILVYVLIFLIYTANVAYDWIFLNLAFTISRVVQNVVASKLNTPEEWEALSGNCVHFPFFRVTTTVGTLYYGSEVVLVTYSCPKALHISPYFVSSFFLIDSY